MKSNAIRWLLFSIVVAVSGGGLYYTYQNTRPCAHPILYSIGAVDTRFDISNSALIAQAKVSAAIWNKAAGKTVLTYDPKGDLKIHLIYDEREANAKFGSRIAVQQDKADTERAALDALQAQYVARQAAYNDAVNAINARGGATREEAATLNAERDALNVLADSINTEVAAFNASVNALNVLVAEFNQTAGYTFEEGQYVRDATGERINIFEFIGNTQLKRVLAHEFGHAIGLGHDADPKSIMFAKNESGNLVPTASDLAALRTVCGA